MANKVERLGGANDWWRSVTRPRVLILLVIGSVFVVVGLAGLRSAQSFLIAILAYVAAFKSWRIYAEDRERSVQRLGIRRQLELVLSKKARHEEWEKAGQRLGLTSKAKPFGLEGRVNGIEVQIALVNDNTVYRVGTFDHNEADLLSESEKNALRMRLHASPTVKDAFEAYPRAEVGTSGIQYWTLNMERSPDTMVDTVNDLVGFLNALKAEF
ncbi:MAG: hypothetical protein OER12_00575 [Acidimicrobiia bacterium]|nr:hypothetical protein [Acidimicrobiia bacterium]